MVQSAAPAAIEYPPLDSGQHVMTPNVLIVAYRSIAFVDDRDPALVAGLNFGVR
jgi:hypothetical protein